MVIITECKRKRHKNEVWLGVGVGVETRAYIFRYFYPRSLLHIIDCSNIVFYERLPQIIQDILMWYFDAQIIEFSLFCYGFLLFIIY